MITRNQRVKSDEITRIVGLLVTTCAKTAFDLAVQLPTGKAVTRLDTLMQATPYSS
uniref:U1764ab n=1 Tax=Mycobacterium leprae TaxID=1769 RepID=Q50012_MYCLR|nr:u1764ab [Mycobacterium leprae]